MTSHETSRIQVPLKHDDSDDDEWGHLLPRHRARLVALQVLYEVDISGHEQEDCGQTLHLRASVIIVSF